MKKLFRNIFEFVRNSGDKLRKAIVNYANPVVTAMSLVKAAVDSPAADAVVKLTKTDVDDKVLEAVRKALAKFTPKAKTLAQAAKQLAQLKPELREAYMSKAAAMAVKELAAEKHPDMKDSDAALMVEMAVKAKKEGAKL